MTGATAFFRPMFRGGRGRKATGRGGAGRGGYAGGGSGHRIAVLRLHVPMHMPMPRRVRVDNGLDRRGGLRGCCFGRGTEMGERISGCCEVDMRVLGSIPPTCTPCNRAMRHARRGGHRAGRYEDVYVVRGPLRFSLAVEWFAVRGSGDTYAADILGGPRAHRHVHIDGQARSRERDTRAGRGERAHNCSITQALRQPH